MKIEIIEIKKEEKNILKQMLELYNYEISVFTKKDLDKDGYFGYPYLDNYFVEERRYPYFIMVDGNYGGFVLVHNHCEILKDEDAHTIGEFFVLKKYREKGIGRYVANTIFTRLKGQWEIKFLKKNLIAYKFWESIILDYTDNYNFLNIDNKFVAFVFDNRNER